jgi:hypothetical protein
MIRLRSAGLLIGIPPLVQGLRFLELADVSGSLTGTYTTDFLRFQFAFWDSDIPSGFRLRVALNLVLFLAAVITCLAAITVARARVVVIVVAAAQAVVAITGLMWEGAFIIAPLAGSGVPPGPILHTIPVNAGRYTSSLYLTIALVALRLALSETSDRPIDLVRVGSGGS